MKVCQRVVITCTEQLLPAVTLKQATLQDIRRVLAQGGTWGAFQGMLCVCSAEAGHDKN